MAAAWKQYMQPSKLMACIEKVVPVQVNQVNLLNLDIIYLRILKPQSHA